VGSQGGFTGGASGYLVHADGTVQSFSRITPDDTMNLQTVGLAGAGEIEALRQAIADPALGRVELHETGNLTAFLDWTAGGERRAFSWGETVADPVLPGPLQKALRAARAAIDSARR
jgi:hypothetical protein